MKHRQKDGPREHPPTTSDNYQEKVLALVANLPPKRGGGIYDVDITHDDWCDFLNRRGFCNCDPVVVVRQPKISAADLQ